MRSYQLKLHCPECWTKLKLINSKGNEIVMECVVCNEIYEMEL